MAAGSYEKEPSAPGSSEMKARATAGTAGVVSRVHESVVNLQVSVMLRDILLSRGYSVLMTRETENVDISNMERAIMANEYGSATFIRIHCNGSSDQNIHGILAVAPGPANPYVGSLYAQCTNLSNVILASTAAITGAQNRGILQSDSMSGINWSKVPVTIIEMGFMSNPSEDLLLVDHAYQLNLATGIANGIDVYFGK